MKDNLTIGTRIRSIRENLNLNRDKFSEMIDISEAFLGQIERGERSLSLRTLMSISETTGYSTDFILFGNNDENAMNQKINKLLNKSSEKDLFFIYNIVRTALSYSKELKNKNND
ncbi:MAG: helix-turn-helix domain-containing protein [Clostridia bacterium]